ncbi:MAG TPA: PQQ-binding-like beta-propeller repeat protein [Polyangiaceae bacterium]
MTFTRLSKTLTPFFLLIAASACGESIDEELRRSDRAEWPFYGHDYENTRANTDERRLSRANVATLEKKWEWTEAAVTSTPVLRGNALYFGTWASNTEAVNYRDGTKIWSADLQPANGINQVNHTPFVTDDSVYSGAHVAQLFALRRDNGERIWEKPVVLEDAPALMLWSSPIVVDDLLIIGVGSYQVFFPVDPASFEVFRGSVVAVNVNTGVIAWQTFMTDVSGVSVWSTAAIDKELGLLFIGTGQPYDREPESPMSDALVALDYKTGVKKWHRQFTGGDVFQLRRTAAEVGPDHDVGASPNLFKIGKRAVVGVADKEGTYYTLDRASGEEVWRKKLTPGGANGGVMASTAYHAGVIYIASNDGASGGRAGAGGGPARGVIFALNAKDGSVRWEAEMDAGTFGGVTYANGLLFVPMLDGTLRVFDTANGGELWRAQVGDTMAGGVTVARGMVFVGHGWAWLPLAQLKGGLVAFGLPE